MSLSQALNQFAQNLGRYHREWMTIRKSDKHHRNNVLRDSAHVLYSRVAHVSFQES